MSYLHFSILPEKPVGPSVFWGALAGATVKAYTLFVDGTSSLIGETIIDAPPPPADPPDNRRSYATIAIEVDDTVANEFDSKDVRIEIWDTDNELLYAHTIAYNFFFDDETPFNFDNPDYDSNSLNKKSKGYLFLPLHPGGHQALVREDGLAAPFDELLEAVKDVLQAEKIEGEDVFDGGEFVLDRALTYPECLEIARELIGYGKGKHLPKPRKKLRKLYKFKEDEDGAIDEDDGENENLSEKREQFERNLREYYTKIEQDARRLSKDVYALCCALWAKKEVKEERDIQFLLPTTILPYQNGRELIISNLPAGYLQVPASFFYALGVELPERVDHQSRYEQAIASEQRILLEIFDKAAENQIIESYPLGEKKRVVRQFRAIDQNRSTSLLNYNCEENADSSGVEALIELWGSSDEETSELFWTGLTNVSALEGHNDLVLFLLVEGNATLYAYLDPQTNGNQLTLPEDSDTPYNDDAPYPGYDGPTESATAEDWRYIYYRSIEDAAANDSVTFLPNGTIEEKAEFFALHALDFFNQNVVAETESIDFPEAKPVPSFIYQENLLDTLIQQLNNNFSTENIEAVINDTDHDECAKDWLRQKLVTVTNLKTITAGITRITDSALQQTAMETLYSLGITSLEQLQMMGEDAFQQCVQGTMLDGYTFDDLGGVDDQPVSEVSEVSQAVNDGRLTDCRYPEFATKLGKFAYLQDLLHFKVGGTTVETQLAESTGLHFGDLAVSAANAEVEVPQMTLVNTVLEEAVCVIEGTGETTSCWRPYNVLLFIVSLIPFDGNYDEKTTNINQVIFKIDNLDTNCEGANCIKVFLQEIITLTLENVEDDLQEIVEVIRTLISLCPPTPIGELTVALEELPENGLALSLKNCIADIWNMPEDERQDCAAQLEAEFDQNDDNEVADAVIQLIQQPVQEIVIEAEGESGVTIGNTLATPSHTGVKHCAYDPISKAGGHCSLPYHYLEDVNNSYLRRLGTDRYQLLRKFCTSIHAFAPASGSDENPEGFQDQRYRFPLTLELSLAYLGISPAEYDLYFTTPPTLDISSPDGPFIFEWYGLSDWAGFENLDLQRALDVLCLDCCELLELSQADNRLLPIVIGTRTTPPNKFTSCTECDLRSFYIGFDYPTGQEEEQYPAAYWRLFLMSRLYRPLKKQYGDCYSFTDLLTLADDLNWFPEFNEIAPHFLQQLAAVDLLRTELGVCPFLDHDGTRLPISLLLNADNDHYAKVLEHFIDGLVDHCEKDKPAGECRPPAFRKLLVEQVELIAELTGFSADVHFSLAWNYQFTNIIRFAEQLQRICTSPFSLGQLRFLFTADEQLVGDDPAPLQTRNEAQENPFGLVDNDPELELASLRKKLLSANVQDEEVAQYTWTKIDSILRTKYGYTLTGADDLWTQFGKFFFPNTLSSLGYIITNEDRQVRADLPISPDPPLTAPQMWSTGTPASPFQYDSITGELFVTLPIATEGVLEKLQEVRQLNEAEQAAVISCLQQPLQMLNRFAGLFTDYQEARMVLLETVDEAARWQYFARAFMLYNRRCEIVTQHLTAQIGLELGDNGLDPGLTWKILAKINADDNPNENAWESTDPIDLKWKLPWQASAFTALCGLTGNGLKGEYFNLEDNSLLWREICTKMEAYGDSSNKMGIAIPGILPNMNFSLSPTPSVAQIRNGFAFSQQNGQSLGGAQGWLAKYCGVLYVEERGTHRFRVGAPSPVGEVPDFEAAKHARWHLELKRGNKIYQVLDHDWESPDTPGDCSVPMQLKPGAYDICFWYERPQLGFNKLEDDCPHESGWTVKWQTPGREDWQVIDTQHLYHSCPYGDLSLGVATTDTAKATLEQVYRPGISGIRRSYLRAYAAGLLFHGFDVSANEVSDSGHAEVDYLLSHPNDFAGVAYTYDEENIVYQPHTAPLYLDLLPVLDNYCPPDETEDKRSAPSKERVWALFSIWERLWEMWQLKKEAANEGLEKDKVCLLFFECDENHMEGASKLHLERYLGIHPHHHTAVTTFCPDKTLKCEDFHSELWAIRVWKAHQCLHHWMCALGNLDFSEIVPAQWTAVTFDETGEQGAQSLINFVSTALETGPYPRTKERQAIQEGIIKRSQVALWAYLQQREEAQALLSLLPASTATCGSCTRLDFGVSLVHNFLNGIRIGVHSDLSIRFSEKERLRWENKLSTYQSWRACQLRDCRPEDFIEYTIIKEDRKSPGFRLLEDQLAQNVLSMPVSGGTTFINPTQHPPLGTLLPFQSRQNSIINTTTEALGTRTPSASGFGDYHGRPSLPIRPDWDTAKTGSLESSIDFWLETVQRAGRGPIRIAAAGAPTANLHIGCSDSGCCPSCGGENYTPVDEWWFWLVDSHGYQEIKQACEQWKVGYQLAELLYLPENPVVYLAWAPIYQGKLQQVCWSSESIKINQEPGELKFRGRFGDSLYLEVDDGVTSLEPTSYNPDDPGNPITLYDDDVIKPGFRFDIVTQEAVIIPQLGEIIPYLSENEDALLSYCFAYFDEGAPAIPKQPHGISLVVAEQLQQHCQYAVAKDWLDISLSLSSGQLGWERYINNNVTMPEEADARRRALTMAQLENFKAWVEHLHRKNTKESLNQAMQLLTLAAQWMGPRPITVHKEWAEDIALRDFQPLSLGLNPRLLCLYDAFADAKGLLEHCLSASRRSCHEPGATAAYPDCAPMQCCSPLEMCIPDSPYRYQVLLNYAKEYAGQLSALGDALLSAFEKGESETLSFIRESQAKQIQDLSLLIKKNLAIEAKFNVDAAEKALEIAKKRLMYYQGLINVGLIAEEQDNLSLTDQAMVLDAVSQVIRISSQGPNFIPTVFVGPFPLTETAGGRALANWFQAGSDAARIAGGIQRTRSGKKATQATYIRRLAEWEHQREILTIEVKQLEIQLLATNRRFANARQELNLHRLQLDHTRQVTQFLKNKFSGEELYHWQRKELAKLFYQMYECSLQLALQAEKACNVEQGYTQQQWLDIPLWDNFHEGLLSGRKLNMALRKMEQGFMNQNLRRYELNKAISLRRDSPRALLQLKYSGNAFFELLEGLFAGDYPGHYCRLIRSVALTIPSVVGPYTNVNATLSLMGSKVRISPQLATPAGHCRGTESTGYAMHEDDSRFVILPATNQAMATSKGMQDSGMFQLNFQDERLLIFENHGVNARFCLDMPIENNQFDMHTISDVMMEINYTAKEGGPLLAKAAKEATKDYLPGNGERLICLQEDRPDDWYQFQQDGNHRLAVNLGRADFTYIPGQHELFVDQVEIFIETAPCPPCDSIDVYFQEPEDSDCIDCDDTLIRCVQLKHLGGLFHGVLSHYFEVSNDRLLLGGLKFPEDIVVKRVYLLLGYGKKASSCPNHDALNVDCGC